MKWHKLCISLVATLVCAVILLPSGANAAASKNTKVRVHILTLECVLENINNGITNISSLQPSDCEKEAGSSPPLPLPDSPEGSLVISPAPEITSPGLNSSLQASQINDLQLDSGQFSPLPEPNIFVKGVATLFQALVASLLVAPFFLLVSRFVAAIFLRR